MMHPLTFFSYKGQAYVKVDDLVLWLKASGDNARKAHEREVAKGFDAARRAIEVGRAMQP